MKIHCSKKQRGVVVVLVVVILPVLLLAMGWALDFGHVFVNKTRLQNALDATALSAAIAINGDVAKDAAKKDRATAKGIATFNLFKVSSGNAELKNLKATDLKFEYFATLPTSLPLPPSFNPATDNFAFVRVTSTNMLNVTPVLIRIMDEFSGDIAVPAIATAGPIGNNCSVAPFVMCATMQPDDGNPDTPATLENPIDPDCADDPENDNIFDCYGYTIGEIRDLEQMFCKSKNDCTEINLEAGNFTLLNLAEFQGGNDIRNILKGKIVNTCTNDLLFSEELETKGGRTWGAVREGVNYRIDNDTVSSEDYDSPTAYQDYQNDGGSEIGFRVMAVPIADCRGVQQGTSPLRQVAQGCIFFTKHAPNGSPFNVTIQFLGSCPQNGVWNPENPVLNGPYKIVLFKSKGSGDS